LSAEGGDETFGGYIRYTNIYKKLKILHKTNSNIKTFINAVLENPLINHFAYNTHIFNDLCYRLVRRFSYFQVSNENEILNLEMSNFTMQELEVLLKHIKEGSMATNFCDYLNQNWLDNILAVDYKTYNIDDCLVKVDRATMSSGLEGREPMLDFRIIEHVARLDPSLKIRNGDKKYILKQIAYKYIPKELLDRPKKGFSAPIERWLRESPDLISCYLNKKSLDKSHIFNSDKIIDLRDRFFNGKKISPSKIWYLLMFEMWREKWCP
jgi:asparagine synthase (glutamine-hydrolysing)